jgi:hypothetical protein
LSGATALVTGASSGIGREIALRAAGDCATVVLVARREERLRELAREIESRHAGVEARVVVADLSDAAERHRLHADLESAGLHVDWLVNNAGFGLAGRADRLPTDQLQSMVELNVAALQHLALLFLPAMVERGRGGVLNVASTAAFQPMPYMATYGATKAFVLSFSEALWKELQGTGVTVTCLCPGRTATEFFDDARMDGLPFMSTPASSPATVARAGWRALTGGRRRVIVGLQNRLGAWMATLSPRRLVLAVTAKLFRT